MDYKEYLVTKRLQRIPTHPGLLFKEDVLPSLGISITKASQELGISRQTLHRILNTTHPITPAMALRFGKFCNNDPAMWLRMQQAYDLKMAEIQLSEELKKIPVHTVSLH